MAITAVSGPQITFGITMSSSGGVQEYNEERGPSLVDLGEGLLDPRPQFTYKPGNPVGSPVFAWPGLFGGPVVDFTPSAVSSNNIGTSTTLSSVGGAVTLVSVSGAGITAGVSITAPETGKTVTGLLAIDGLCGGTSNAGVGFGQGATVQLWNPATVCTRGITINLTSNADAGTWTIAGRDAYGFKVTESLTAGSTQLKSKKTYKYISSISGATTTTSTGVTIGTQDLYGFPLRVDHPAYATIWWGASSNATLVSLSTGAHVFAVTSAASNTTGDVRGTFTSSAASSGIQKVVMNISPSVANMQSITATSVVGLLGLTQFSSV